MGIGAYCNAEIIQEPDLIRQLMRMLSASDELSSSMSDSMRTQVQDSISKRVVVRLKPYRFVSWDHGKLADKY
jgi:hypothetical protein